MKLQVKSKVISKSLLRLKSSLQGLFSEVIRQMLLLQVSFTSKVFECMSPFDSASHGKVRLTKQTRDKLLWHPY